MVLPSTSDPSACPDENLLVEHARGLSSEQRRHGILAHLERCADCALLLAEAIDDVDSSARRASETPSELAQHAGLGDEILVRGATVG